MLLLPLGIGPRQARVLDALSRMGEVSQVTLAKEFGITQASMSTMTNRLMASGHVVRRDDPADTRGKLLSLSDGGHAMLERAYQAWNELDQHASDAIGADAYKALTSGARNLRDALGGHAPGAPSKNTICPQPTGKDSA